MQVHVGRHFPEVGHGNGQRCRGTVFKIVVLLVLETENRFKLRLRWRAAGAEPERVNGAAAVVLAAFLEHAQTHRLRRLDERLLVESRQRLQRRVRADAAGAGVFGRRGVEGDQRRKRQGAFPERVHATAIAVLTRALRPRQSPIDRVPDARGNRRKHTRPADFEVQQPARGERNVLNDFGFDAKSRAAGEQPVVRVFGQEPRRNSRCLPIAGRFNDQTVQRFNTPPRVHKFAGQPVEQLRMRRCLAARAEILRRGHQALAEIGLPDAVHDDARGRRTAPVHQPPGETEAVARCVLREGVQQRGHVRPDRFARPLPIAPLENVGLARHGALLQRERRRGVRPVGQYIVNLLVHLREGRVLVAEGVEQVAHLLGRALLGRNRKNRPLRCGKRVHFQFETFEFVERTRPACSGRRLADRSGRVRADWSGLDAGLARRHILFVAAGRCDGHASGVSFPALCAFGGGAEAEPAQRVAIEPALLVQFAAVAVAARVLLINRKLQSGPAGKTDNRLGAFEDRAMLRVPTNRNRRRGPAAFFRVAINRVGDAETGRFHIRERATEPDLVRHRRAVQRGGFTSEFLEQKAAFGHQARSAIGQVRVRQRFETEPGQVRERRVHPDVGDRAGLYIAARHQ